MQNQFKNISIGVIGLGYVGLPVLVHLSKKFNVVGFDINEKRVSELKNGTDQTGEVDPVDLKNPNLFFSSNSNDLDNVNFYIVAVPTPIDEYNRPDLTPLKRASETVGNSLSQGDIVVYESTVFPGATEDYCGPILEKVSGLRREDFKLGYSPERINPGDKEHTFDKITKVVSGEDSQTTEVISHVYSSVVEAGIYRASSIKVAEAAKVIENTQRDLNIALMNELSLIFNKMKIDTNEVIDAASSKWNFLPFRPGLVGGHCIGVDPYYLTYAAEKYGYIPQVILAGRRINDSIGKFVAGEAIKLLAKSKHNISKSLVTILGVTFKQDCPDIRNSKVFDIISELNEYGLKVQISDPLASPEQVYSEYGVKLTRYNKLQRSELVILAVPHKEYLELGKSLLTNITTENSTLIDIKSCISQAEVPENVSKVWKL